jgi:hypothetical protein
LILIYKEIVKMLASYIDKAMELAVYEIIEDDGTYWGEIPGLQGVWANYKTLRCKAIAQRSAGIVRCNEPTSVDIPLIEDINLNQITQLV